jgi:hypothetical protein
MMAAARWMLSFGATVRGFLVITSRTSMGCSSVWSGMTTAPDFRFAIMAPCPSLFGSTPMKRNATHIDYRGIFSAVVRARSGASLPSGGDD